MRECFSALAMAYERLLLYTSVSQTGAGGSEWSIKRFMINPWSSFSENSNRIVTFTVEVWKSDSGIQELSA